MDRKIKCILIEDETPAFEIFQNFISNFNQFELLGHFTDVFKAEAFLKNNSADVIFLDIQLPGLSGMEYLETMNVKPLVIITSAYKEHSLKAFEFSVFDYLLKPYSLKRFTSTIQKIETRFKHQPLAGQEFPSHINIKSNLRNFRVELDSILFAESKKEYVEFNLTNEQVISARMTMEEVLELIGTMNFIQIHRSYIVQKRKIKSITSSKVEIEKNTLPIGRSFKVHVENYWSRG